MSQIIPLDAVPNQSLSVQLGDLRYDMRLIDLGEMTALDLTINDETVLQGERIVAGTPLIPYPYLEGEGGNFIFLTENNEFPYWQKFGVTQSLIYFDATEMAEFRG